MTWRKRNSLLFLLPVLLVLLLGWQCAAGDCYPDFVAPLGRTAYCPFDEVLRRFEEAYPGSRCRRS